MTRVDPARLSHAAIFDLDGTLADTFDLVVDSFITVTRPHLGRDMSRQEVIDLFGPTEVQMLRNVLPPHLHESAIARYRELYASNHRRLVRIFDGIPELLQHLHAMRIPMAIMTGKGRDTCDITLAELGWTHLFGSIITGDEVTHPKPAPEGPLKAARELGIAPQDCLFIGDSPADIRAGQAAGMTTVWASWHRQYEKEVRALQPDIIATTPSGVARLFESST